MKNMLKRLEIKQTSKSFLVQGVPINMTIFMNTILQYSSINILNRKWLVLRFSKWGLPFLNLQNWRRYWKICTNFNLFNKSKLSLYLITSSIFRTRERYIGICRPLSVKLVRRTTSLLYFLCHSLNIRDLKRLSSRLSTTMFIGTPWILQIKNYSLIIYFRTWNVLNTFQFRHGNLWELTVTTLWPRCFFCNLKRFNSKKMKKMSTEIKKE